LDRPWITMPAMPWAHPAKQQKNAFYPFEQLALLVARNNCTDTT
jgi:hypothetical protein